ncbi:hypothetical protein [Nocardia pseudovaccinii]|uniref:hypothetical protein n=1 Tax=Nocardia pseudovaccinii TaxID=189540 RepID=UPI0007A53095|nr:hypothetical protein [Nocardia pseudovaccinii]
MAIRYPHLRNTSRDQVAEDIALAYAHEQYRTDVHEEAILALLRDDLRPEVGYRAVKSSTDGEIEMI